jgi:hypothetical protein
MHLSAIRPDRGQHRFDGGHDANRGRHVRAKRSHRGRDDRGQADRRHAEACEAREHEQLAREIRGAAAGPLDARERLAERFRQLGPLQHEVRVAEHADEQVVEVVRDPAGEYAEALQVSRLASPRPADQALALATRSANDLCFELRDATEEIGLALDMHSLLDLQLARALGRVGQHDHSAALARQLARIEPNMSRRRL